MTKRFKLRAVNDKRTYGAISENGELIKMDNVVDLLNALHEENERLKNQRKVYDKFLDLNDLEIEWQFLCDADKCNEEQDKDCRDCKYLGVLE